MQECIVIGCQKNNNYILWWLLNCFKKGILSLWIHSFCIFNNIDFELFIVRLYINIINKLFTNLVYCNISFELFGFAVKLSRNINNVCIIVTYCTCTCWTLTAGVITWVFTLKHLCKGFSQHHFSRTLFSAENIGVTMFACLYCICKKTFGVLLAYNICKAH